MIYMPQLEEVYELPRIIFTLSGEGVNSQNPKSTTVLKELAELADTVLCKVFGSKGEIAEFFQTLNITPASAVAVFDRHLGKKHFHPTCRNRRHEVQSPDWAMGAQWLVIVGENCDPRRCSRQVYADFVSNFALRLGKNEFPWGRGKLVNRGTGTFEEPPRPVTMPAEIHTTIAALNDGPDLAAAIADKAFAAELPTGSKISWYRVVPSPLPFNGQMLEEVLGALREFERVSSALVREDTTVQKLLLAGVDLPADSAIANAYLFPRVDCFSVGRPDLHYTGTGLPYASEIDEMPGGMPELVHIDNVYGINQDRWKRAFDWLCGKGRLVFLVSHAWSMCYIPETEWLVGHLNRLGYPVDLLTTDRLNEIELRTDGLYFKRERIGTIWRQFPIFETRGKLVDIVMAAREGRVRLVPEFAHFGNKAWFSVFRSRKEYYAQALNGHFQILDQVLPHSFIVDGDGNASFPMKIGEFSIGSMEDLKNASQPMRDGMVLKICGANNLAARSYGVLMGVGIDQNEWIAWIDTRRAERQPFVVQRRLESGIARIPVMNVKTNLPELFTCRIMARPWSFNGEPVSIHGCAVPSYLYRVHGMVDMAVVPFAL
jgi:hypothetical protein